MTTTAPDDHSDVVSRVGKDGHFKRPDSKFRSWISSEPGAEFPPEKDRYVLYLNLGCPWAHRANIVRSLKGLEDNVVAGALAPFNQQETNVAFAFQWVRESDGLQIPA